MIFSGGMSGGQARANARELGKMREKAYREELSRRLAGLREQEAAARKVRRAEVDAARARCHEGAEKAKAEADAAFARAVELAKVARALAKQAARDACAIDKAHARSEGDAAIAAKRIEREEARKLAAEVRRTERSKADAERERRKRDVRARSSESDDEVRANLDPGLVPLFDLMRRRIKANPRQSRTEAFQHYAAEHPGEVLQAQEVAAEKWLRAELRKQAANAPRAPRRIPRHELPPAPF